ncbi:glycosyl transferase family 90-domain-containing protein [Aspergillus karnatakaensis]|uniref:DUF821 domain protein n=1 Tax=Aspergillus karnatakaensis TaxID=1810916 RepID=UPI003CCCA9A9
MKFLVSPYLRYLGAGAVLSVILLTFLLFDRNSDSYFTNSGARGYILKQPVANTQCANAGTNTDSSSSSEPGSGRNATREWTFDVRRDGDNHGLSHEQCLAAFPKLFIEIDKAVKERLTDGGKGLISFKEVDDLASGDEDGLVRAVIRGGELYIIDFGNMPYTFSRGKATLHSLNRALAAYPDRHELPDIEFVFSTDDYSNGKSPIWSYSKRAQDTGVWLMPDFGYWSWPEVKVGSYKEIRRKIAAIDDGDSSSSSSKKPGAGLPFHSKKKQLAWRGSLAPNPEIRGSLLAASKGKSWASIKEINWPSSSSSSPSSSSTPENLLPMENHCTYMFLAHTEGRSFSGRGKYLLNCRSVFVSHKLEWIEAHHGALISSGPEQNYVEVERDFSDLERKIEFLLDNPETAERIAQNSVRVFRDRYLTPAAESCYWRALVRAYGGASGFVPVLTEGEKEKEKDKKMERGVAFESWVLQK